MDLSGAMALLIVRQRWQQLFVDGLTHGGLDTGATGVHVLDHLAQLGCPYIIQPTHRTLAGLLSRGADRHLKPQCLELSQQVFMINQVGVHHEANPSSATEVVVRFW